MRNLLGEQLEDWTDTRKRLVVHHFRPPQEWCDYYKADFGPTIATYAAIADDPALTARLDSDFLAFGWSTTSQIDRIRRSITSNTCCTVRKPV